MNAKTGGGVGHRRSGDVASTLPRPRSVAGIELVIDPDADSLAEGFRSVALLYGGVVLALVTAVLPRDAEVRWGWLAAGLALFVAVIGVVVLHVRRLKTGGTAAPAAQALLQLVTVMVAAGCLNVGLAGASGLYRPVIFVPAMLAALIGNRRMMLLAMAAATVITAASAALQGVQPSVIPAVTLASAAVFGAIAALLNMIAHRTAEAMRRADLLAEVSSITATTEQLEAGLLQFLPRVHEFTGSRAVAAIVPCADGTVQVVGAFPPGPVAEVGEIDWSSPVDDHGGVVVLSAVSAGGTRAALVLVDLPRRVGDLGATDYQLHRLATQLSLLTERASLVEQLREMARVDDLTGLPNRRELRDRLDLEVARLRRSGGHLSVAMLDLDHFKTYNDEFGHPAGDQVLQAFGALLSNRSRSQDLATRYGGEEFCLVLPDTDADGAVQLLADLHARCRSLIGGQTITFSAGVASTSCSEAAQWLIPDADHALYEAKASGRNCTRTVAATARGRDHDEAEPLGVVPRQPADHAPPTRTTIS